MTRKYTKAEAIGIVVRCAQTYKQELDGKNYFECINDLQLLIQLDSTDLDDLPMKPYRRCDHRAHGKRLVPFQI